MTKTATKRRKVRGEVTVLPDRCKGCGFCVEFCPTHVLAMSESFNTKGYHPPSVLTPEACNGCDLCGIYCPDFAIFGVRIKQTGDSEEAGEPAEGVES